MTLIDHFLVQSILEQMIIHIHTVIINFLISKTAVLLIHKVGKLRAIQS